MSRLARAFESMQRNPNVKVLLDLNPDYGGNAYFVNTINNGGGSPQSRLQHHLAQFGIRYFAINNVDSLAQCQDILADYGLNNCGDGQIVLMWDRRPVGIEAVAGQYPVQLHEVVLC